MTLNPTVFYVNDSYGPCGLVVWVQPSHPAVNAPGTHAVHIGHKVVPYIQGVRSLRIEAALKAVVGAVIDWADSGQADLIDLDVSLLVNGDPSGAIMLALSKLDTSMYDVDVSGTVGPSNGFARITPDDWVRRALSLT